MPSDHKANRAPKELNGSRSFVLRKQTARGPDRRTSDSKKLDLTCVFP